MINTNFNEFKTTFKNTQKKDRVVVRYPKEKNNETIHKEIKINHKSGKYFVEVSEYNKTQKIRNSDGKSRITDKSLKGKHAYLATLFATLERTPEPKISNWKKFRTSQSKIKWITRFFILNTFLIGGVVGRIIAYSANKGNPHYRTSSSRILAKTLGPLIFPGGSKKPLIERRGMVLLDPVLHKQYKAMRNYSSTYRSHGKKIHFKRKQVSMELRKKTIKLETIVASNSLVKKKDKDHLHVIYFNGNSSGFYQDYRSVAEDLLHYAADHEPVTAVQFNYPGILNSTGEVKVAQELIDAGIAQVQRLLDKGVSHDKIVLHGVSLGGSVASHVAAHFHKQKMPGNSKQRQTLGGLYVSRSFASTTQVGRDFFNRALGDNIFSRIISSVCLPFIKIGTWGAEWDLDTGKAFFSLPKNRRNYSVVISSKADRKAYRKQLNRSKWKKVVDCILGRKINPVDDAILRRGLHNSWERQKDGFWIKCGFKGRKAKKAYSKENRSRKMIVYDFANNKHAPEVDGHVKGNYCYQNRGAWYNAKNKANVIGLLHRSKKPIEAGALSRKQILKMASIGAA